MLALAILKYVEKIQPITDSVSKADILNQYFKSVLIAEDRSYNIPDKGPSCYPSITDFRITSEGVCKVLSHSNLHKSPGPDAIHPCICIKSHSYTSNSKHH